MKTTVVVVLCLLVLAPATVTEARPQFLEAVGDFVENVGEGVGDFFEGVGDFFSNVFSGSSRTRSTPVFRLPQPVPAIPPQPATVPGYRPPATYDHPLNTGNLIIVPD
ncbi:uncharacterized protein [Procambarus clarkii]|uniref:uncharacterized protein n=1 Tax=Procambarus clarkii TaxID=6728 RepID=UPI001E6762BE|nr:uncharacterized protein LOC123774576 [Procambarus clarkii]XP_045624912.1 uncharacterized protein LOC123774576 [Procambarus clarkii]